MSLAGQLQSLADTTIDNALANIDADNAAGVAFVAAEGQALLAYAGVSEEALRGIFGDSEPSPGGPVGPPPDAWPPPFNSSPFANGEPSWAPLPPQEATPPIFIVPPAEQIPEPQPLQIPAARENRPPWDWRRPTQVQVPSIPNSELRIDLQIKLKMIPEHNMVIPHIGVGGELRGTLYYPEILQDIFLGNP
jgi:hypothetical protein